MKLFHTKPTSAMNDEPVSVTISYLDKDGQVVTRTIQFGYEDSTFCNDLGKTRDHAVMNAEVHSAHILSNMRNRTSASVSKRFTHQVLFEEQEQIIMQCNVLFETRILKYVPKFIPFWNEK